jgi:hypothetical protein
VRVRTVASGLAVLALAGVAVPTALSSSAVAKSTAAPTVTACAPAPAIIGKNVTLHGTGLAGATSIAIGKKTTGVVAGPFKHDTAKAITLKVPTGVSTKSGDTVTVTTPNGTSTGVSCTFKKAPKKSHK